MAAWSTAAVWKTVDLNGSGGSNPSLSADKLKLSALRWAFFVHVRQELAPVRTCTKKAQKAGRPLSFNLFRYAPPQAVRDVTHAVRQIPLFSRKTLCMSTLSLPLPQGVSTLHDIDAFRCYVACGTFRQPGGLQKSYLFECQNIAIKRTCQVL